MQLGVDRKQAVNIAKPLQLRARALFLFYNANPSPRTTIPIPRRMYSRIKLFPPRSISVARVRRKYPEQKEKKGMKILIIK